MPDGAGDWVDPSTDDPVVTALSEASAARPGPTPGGTRGGPRCGSCWPLTAVCLALGMWQKTNCYDDTWQDGNARYAHVLFRPAPLYTGRGFAELAWPSEDAQTRPPRGHGVPAGIAYWAYGTAWVTHWLNGSPDLDPRRSQSVGEMSSTDEVHREMRIFVIVNALGFGAGAAQRPGCSPAASPRGGPGTPRRSALSPDPAADRARQLGPARGW